MDWFRSRHGTESGYEVPVRRSRKRLAREWGDEGRVSREFSDVFEKVVPRHAGGHANWHAGAG